MHVNGVVERIVVEGVVERIVVERVVERVVIERPVERMLVAGVGDGRGEHRLLLVARRAVDEAEVGAGVAGDVLAAEDERGGGDNLAADGVEGACAEVGHREDGVLVEDLGAELCIVTIATKPSRRARSRQRSMNIAKRSALASGWMSSANALRSAFMFFEPM